MHTELGPGLLESVYEECLYYELQMDGINVAKQKTMPIQYKNVQLEAGYSVDLLVENLVVVELKAVESFHPVHMAQMITYLRLSGCKIGLLLNFNVRSLRDGIQRVAY